MQQQPKKNSWVTIALAILVISIDITLFILICYE
jgi:hypothetical protein